MEIITIIKTHSGVNEIPICFPIMKHSEKANIIEKAETLFIEKVKKIAEQNKLSYEEMIEETVESVYEPFSSIEEFECYILDMGHFDFGYDSVTLSWAEVII
jgi:hypothetical protein